MSGDGERANTSLLYWKGGGGGSSPPLSLSLPPSVFACVFVCMCVGGGGGVCLAVCPMTLLDSEQRRFIKNVGPRKSSNNF